MSAYEPLKAFPWLQYAFIFVASWFLPSPWYIVFYAVFGLLFLATLGLTIWNVKLRKEVQGLVADMKKRNKL